MNQAGTAAGIRYNPSRLMGASPVISAALENPVLPCCSEFSCRASVVTGWHWSRARLISVEPVALAKDDS
mgnify:CR=1 FL=1